MTTTHKRLIAGVLIIVFWWKAVPGVVYFLKRVWPDVRLIYLLVPVGLGASAISVAVWRIIVRKRELKGRCRKCGYNLTGNVSGVCPECGTEVPAS